jgi:ABC-type Fe3+ transport system substrate-binding protein
MIVTSNVGMLAGAAHPNASKLFMDFLLTKEAQQTMATYPGAGFIRTDVTPADPDAVFKPGVSLFQGNPDTVEFASTYTQYNTIADKYLKELGKR